MSADSLQLAPFGQFVTENLFQWSGPGSGDTTPTANTDRAIHWLMEDESLFARRDLGRGDASPRQTGFR